MNELIRVAELQAGLTDPGLLIFDCRFNLMDAEAGQRAYLASHIPGARYADLNRDLSSPHIRGRTGRHPLPPKEQWIQRVLRWGVSPEKRAVAYDDAGGAYAARLWWMLRWIGHARVAVLDGGWQAWQAEAGPVSTDLPVLSELSTADYGVLPSLTRTIEADDIDGTRQTLLDAREAVRFRGQQEPIDPVAGHIPGALCSPMSANLNAEGYFKTAAELHEKFAVIPEGEMDIVCYCGSGITAAHNILAMRLAGFDEPLLYAGSWSEWITDTARPIATGSEQA